MKNKIFYGILILIIIFSLTGVIILNKTNKKETEIADPESNLYKNAIAPAIGLVIKVKISCQLSLIKFKAVLNAFGKVSVKNTAIELNAFSAVFLRLIYSGSF